MKKTIITRIGLILFFTTSIQAQNDTLEYHYSQLHQYVYTDQDSTYYHADKIIPVASRHKAYDYLFYTLTMVNYSAGYFHNLSKLRESTHLADSLFTTHHTGLQNLGLRDYTDITVQKQFDKGLYYYLVGHYKKARSSFNSMLETLSSLPDSFQTANDYASISSAYNYLAKMYTNEGKYELAKLYYKKDLQFLKEKLPIQQENISHVYRLLGEVYMKEGQYQEANRYILASLNHDLKDFTTEESNSIAAGTGYMVENYLALSKVDSAKHYLSIMRRALTDNSSYAPNYYLNKAAVLDKEKEKKGALTAYLKALELAKAKWNNSPHSNIAQIHDKIASFYQREGQTTLALEEYNKGIAQVYGNSIERSTLNLITLVNLLKNKANALSTFQTTEARNNILQTVDLGIRTLDSLKPTFENHGDKYQLIENAYQLFETGIAASFALYQLDNDPGYIDKAFYYLEKSKSILLMEALLSAKATRFGSVPQSLLEEESSLRKEISLLEKQQHTAKKTSNKIKKRLFLLKDEYHKLMATIEKNHPEYYNLKYNTKVVNLNEIKTLLDSDQAFISYFYGSENLYAITAGNKKNGFYRLDTSKNLNEQITTYYHTLSTPGILNSKLITASAELYAQLLEPMQNDFSAKERLLIVADGALNYIPFESMVVSKETDKINFLAEKKSIGYVNSATLYKELSGKKEQNHSVLAFAPSFMGSKNDKLQSLKSNKDEVAAILGHFKGNGFIDSEATLANFVKEPNLFGILHLATHATVNDTLPELSYLSFEPVEGQESTLHVSDLYNLKLNANLVTLSACETGIGNLMRSEGFISLSRGFYYSGASSIAGTLWKISDESAAELMDYFYKNLAEGKTKDAALAQAKRDFIVYNPLKAHPYFWAGFIVNGDVSPVTAQKNNIVWWVLCFLILGGVVFFVLKRRKSQV
ncbi:hypothetical protein APR41_15965 [Salegentibacter salinarum]|uniref:CHAT domain-containing protein n=1 Tax=Salegentibacter salinarum TaxID=447422 RepID=A0A2N0TXH4_9FLAO|nr:CHAT domain-containing tetratricopeptide repeat protein [Salegentibacter salinarum]PKD19455.1 hypothetical protein APR41_15965 [Salegentibacter salinarum]SKB92070.1 Tetratricopeptide repeat-containing protein [Salegentibacter salinarum]